LWRRLVIRCRARRNPTGELGRLAQHLPRRLLRRHSGGLVMLMEVQKLAASLSLGSLDP
jgi:hypothetical protein